MHFRNRTEAGKQLAKALAAYQGQDAIVYPLPRGGVVLGIEVAVALGLPMDLIIPRKIGHPLYPEYAIAAVSEAGEMVCNQTEVDQVDSTWFNQEVDAQRQEAQRRRLLYAPGKPLTLAGKIAILVDDGIATGLTMEAAIRDARARDAGKIIVAIPVAPRDTAQRLKKQVDELVALDIPLDYRGAVGAYFDEFHQVSDEEVIQMMATLKYP